MKLVATIVSKSWSALNDAARDKRRAAEKHRRDEFERKQRREAIDIASPITLKSQRQSQAWWGAE